VDLKTYELLQEQKWEPIYRELVAFGIYWAQNYHWRHGGLQELTAGQTIADVVQEAIIKTIEGKRSWDPQKGPLVPWLRDQVKSEIDHLYHSAASRHEVLIPESEDGEELTDWIEHRSSQGGDVSVVVSSQNPEEIVLKKEDIEKREDALFQATSGDPELEEILEIIAGGCAPRPRYLAAELGVPVTDVNNRLKRLRRRAWQLLTRED